MFTPRVQNNVTGASVRIVQAKSRTVTRTDSDQAANDRRRNAKDGRKGDVEFVDDAPPLAPGQLIDKTI